MRVQSSETYIRLLIFMIISILGLLIMPINSSVLNPQIGSDYVVFSIVGRGWLNGEIPYLHLFDHKGPVVYLLQMLGQSLGVGKWGIWLLEIVFATISFEIIYQCGLALNLSRNNNIVAAFVSIISYFCYIEGGNTVEEWSLPFQLLPMLYLLRFMNEKNSNIWLPSLIGGICFGVVAMIRINDNCIICGLAIGLVVFLIRQKRFRELWQSIICFIVGFGSICTPFIIYFAYKGALDEMVYANFVFNVHYVQKWHSLSYSILLNFRKLLPCVLLPFIVFYYDRKNKTSFFVTLTLISMVTFITFIKGASYGHYFMMVVPITALGMQLSSKINTVYRAFIIICLLLPAYALIDKPLKNYQKFKKLRAESIQTKYNNLLASAIVEYIPMSDLNSIYTYDGSFQIAGALYELGKIPAGKYFFLQTSLCRVDNYVKEDIKHDFERTNPKWLIASENLEHSETLGEHFSNYKEITSDSLPVIFKEKRIHIYKLW